METHVDEGSPLSNYLEAAGEREDDWDWQEPENREHDISPPLTPPRDFAPRGLAKVRRKFRDRLAKPMQLDLPNFPSHDAFNDNASPILDMLRLLLETVTSSIDHARSIGFLERLRLAIIQSQLLDNPLTLGYQSAAEPTVSQPPAELNFHGLTASGVVAAAVFGFCLASLARWYTLGGFLPTWKRFFVSVALTVALLYIVRAYIRREILRNIQRRGLAESASFFTLSRDFDCANSAALNFIMEVELVARGYRLSTPIPPISRLEKNGQNVKCLQLRHAVRASLAEVIATYYQIAFTIWGFAEQTELLQLQSQYQFTVADVVERFNLFSNSNAQDGEKLQSLKDAAYLFHDIRKVFLSGLLALHTSGTDADRLRFSTVLEAFKELNIVTTQAYTRLKDVLAENDYQMNQLPRAPKSPLSPNHDRWQHQVRRLGSMTMNIRSVQAKLHLLQEESNKALNEANDITEMGPLFMSQYDSIGQDLRDLMEAWQSGKKALRSGINRNEKRLSSIGSVMASPTSTMSGRTIAGDESSTDEHEPGVEDALRKLTGEVSPTKAVMPIEPEVFEAISVPRPRSMLTREERIARMREERQNKEIAKAKADAYRGMVRELEGVLGKKGSRGRVSL
ncbi:Mysoin-binding motif of peroxisomes-domain-containing protein [Xylaria bambusicola]|uniref:Mysoin-binding motif of peroxisomes-domain-containing protein n=1 Tax=Xylaria bambusicola TaxID=326684 RepID=UPI0020089915|nr:Mysoin-binding motif of peroxisomes-domain-containing protein [Xylaria bambusicola]KAI0512481.1 Mysoin-binding motif of peroxisomes-domain-containing protein [Xylaria bambusicola]